MLDGMNVNFPYELPVQRDEQQMLDATVLMRIIQQERHNLLRQLENDF